MDAQKKKTGLSNLRQAWCLIVIVFGLVFLGFQRIGTGWDLAAIPLALVMLRLAGKMLDE